jgi:ketosteroid isomerase-like protein
MMALIHDDIEFENVSGGEVDARASGVEAFRALAEQAKGLFSEREQVMTAFEATEEGASIAVEYMGVLAGDLPNGMKAGEVLRLKGRSAFVFRDGKIRRLTDTS